MRPINCQVPSSSGGNRGRIMSAVFYGPSVEYVVETEAGTIVAVVADPDVDQILSEGEIVQVDFPEDRGWVLTV